MYGKFKHYRPKNVAKVNAAKVTTSFAIDGVRVNAGDYVVDEGNGNLKSVAKDVFESTYETNLGGRKKAAQAATGAATGQPGQTTEATQASPQTEAPQAAQASK